MKVLGIETTCDESAVAVVKDGAQILSNCIASQAKLHEKYGGVFPEMASREHLDAILPLVESALFEAKLSPYDIDLIAVAEGPGLMGSLLMGCTVSQTLSFAWDIPLVGVNHVEAHLYSAMMECDKEPIFPGLGVVLSGGHTFMAKMERADQYQIIGTTVDDALGEAYDKVATLLGLPYPGGPQIEKLAKLGDPNSYPFKAGRVKSNPLSFSFSGLKTSVLYAVKGPKGGRNGPDLITPEKKKDVAASFQHAALTDIADKVMDGTHQFPCRAIYFGGGVTANQALRKKIAEVAGNIPIFWPSPNLSLDNGAMIAGLGHHIYQKRPTRPIHPFPQLK